MNSNKHFYENMIIKLTKSENSFRNVQMFPKILPPLLACIGFFLTVLFAESNLVRAEDLKAPVSASATPAGGSPQGRDYVNSNCWDKAYLKAREAECESNEESKQQCLKNLHDRYERSCSGTNKDPDESRLNDCKEKSKDFNKNYSDFLEACSKAKMGNGIVGCLTASNTCILCNGASSDPDKDDGENPCARATQGNAAFYGDLATQVLLGVPTVSTQKTLEYEDCPSMAAEDLKDFRKDVETAQKDNKKTQEEIDKAKEELAKKIKESTDIDSKHADNLEALDKKVQEKVKEFKDKQKGANDSQEKNYSDVQMQIQKAQQTKRDLSNKMVEANASLLDEISKLKQNCNTAALTQLTNMQNGIAEKIKAKSYTAGGFSAALSRAGLTSQKQADAYLKSFFRTCTKSFSYTESEKSIRRKFDLVIANLKTQQGDIDTLVANLTSELEKSKSKLSEVLQELADDLQSYMNESSKLYDKENADYQNQKQTKLLEITNAQDKITNLQNQLQKEQMQLQQKEMFLSIREAKSKGASTELGATDKVTNSESQLVAEARSTIEACYAQYNDLCKLDEAHLIGGEGSDIRQSAKSNASSAASFLKTYYGLGGSKECSSSTDINDPKTRLKRHGSTQ